MSRILGFVVFLTLYSSVKTSIDKKLLDGILEDGEDGNLNAMLDKLGGALGELVDAVGTLESVCKYECPPGKTPVEKEGHKKTSNGCGSFGLQIDTPSLQQMTQCCDKHDLCYDTCNNPKEDCDAEFQNCLKDMCKNMKLNLDKEEYEGCKATAELMYTGTNMLGCSAYRKAQSKTCDCKPKKKNIQDKYKQQSTKKKQKHRKMEL